MCKYQFERGKVYYLAAVEKYQMKCYKRWIFQVFQRYYFKISG